VQLTGAMTMVDAYESDVYWGVNSNDDIFLSQGGYIQTVNSGDNINLGQQTSDSDENLFLGQQTGIKDDNPFLGQQTSS
jgi:hypothetical protein